MEDTERLDDKAFSNGDTYKGNFKGVLPHGKGKYIWSDGTYYEGDWEEGQMSGKGLFVWPSRARYDGDVSGGYLHGHGTLNGVDNSVYRGAWRMGLPHGIGRKEYYNSDIYEGAWKEGIHEGCGRYTWSNGNSYTGNWKRGKMSGRGIMKWVNGDIYDGLWFNGMRHGSGIYKFADGSYYFGSWSKGLKDGKGTFYPAGTKHPPPKRFSNSREKDSRKNLPPRSPLLASDESTSSRSSVHRSVSEKVLAGKSSRNSGRISHKPVSFNDNWCVWDPDKEFASDEESCIVSDVPQEDQREMGDDSAVIYEREYMQGVLIQEKVRENAKSSAKNKQTNKFPIREAKLRSCMDVPIINRSYYLMLNLQQGIRYTVGKITPVPRREVRSSDFGDRARIKMYFPRRGSRFTPPHYSISFYWKDYCPMVFRNLREMFKLDAAEYMMSICGDDSLRELSSSGKSGSLFYVSHDDRFVIKTLKKSELKVFLRMLPNYYHHVGKYENTLITKFFGVHRIKLRGGRKVRFVVMGNMFCTELRIHRRYDLKGSTVGRFTSKEKITQTTTLKDLDLPYEFHMDKLLRESLFNQLSLDSKFLESQEIIDYSLLLGLHFRAPEHLKGLLDTPNAIRDQDSSSVDGINSSGELVIPAKGLVLVTHEPSSVDTAPGPHIRGRTLRAYSVGEREVDLLLPGTARLRVQLGVNMPAQANHKLMQEEVEDSAAEVELFEVYDVVLYMGIIDILQAYNLKKKAEHAYKSLHLDPLQISVVEPKFYAKRFINYLEKVFPINQN